jgi:hypothetical protein
VRRKEVKQDSREQWEKDFKAAAAESKARALCDARMGSPSDIHQDIAAPLYEAATPFYPLWKQERKAWAMNQINDLATMSSDWFVGVQRWLEYKNRSTKFDPSMPVFMTLPMQVHAALLKRVQLPEQAQAERASVEVDCAAEAPAASAAGAAPGTGSSTPTPNVTTSALAWDLRDKMRVDLLQSIAACKMDYKELKCPSEPAKVIPFMYKARVITLENALGCLATKFGLKLSEPDREVLYQTANLQAGTSVCTAVRLICELFEQQKIAKKSSPMKRCAAAGLLIVLWHNELKQCFPKADIDLEDI